MRVFNGKNWVLETIELSAPVYAKHYAMRRVIEYPVSGRIFPNRDHSLSSFTHIPKYFTKVAYIPEEPWNAEKHGTLWALEVSVRWFRVALNDRASDSWMPFAWATELEDACTIIRHMRPDDAARIVHVVTGEEIPLHVL